jgi:hypothetical protein
MLIIYIGHQREVGEYVQTPIQLEHLHQKTMYGTMYGKTMNAFNCR